jgi:hypothetical protein
MIDLTRFSVHHLGIAVSASEFDLLSKSKEINYDEVQGVRTFFDWDSHFDCYIEYFTTTGRASNYNSGFNHVCYNLENRETFEKQIAKWKSQGIAIQVTPIEKSGSPECNFVVFCFIAGIGIVEFNIND